MKTSLRVLVRAACRLFAFGPPSAAAAPSRQLMRWRIWMSQLIRSPMLACWLTGAVLSSLASPALAVGYTFRKVLDYTGLFLDADGPSLNDHGSMAFPASRNDDTYGAYALTEAGDLVTIADSSMGYNLQGFGLPLNGHPSINNSNVIAFAA